MTLFAALPLEVDPSQLRDLPQLLPFWVRVVGGFAFVGLVLWLLLGLPRWRPADRAAVPGWMAKLFLGATVLAGACYLVGVPLYWAAGASAGAPAADSRPGAAPAPPAGGPLATTATTLLTVGGLAALVAVGLPFVRNLFELRGRRIYALAKLSFKEALRRRVLYAFSGVLLVFLFGSWFIPGSGKPSDEVRTYVATVSLVMTVFLLFIAVLLASFSIPTDIKQQTIHTIVTKPVERFEVVLGRFLGFFALMTLVLLLMTAVSLLYVLRGVNPAAAAESLKARVPVYGELRFENTDSERYGTNVGREWDYRSYITGSASSANRQTARWDFAGVPGALGDRPQVRLEFGFDIYRTTKGQENKGVPCDFVVRTWRYREGDDAKYQKERRSRPATPEVESELAEKYGYHEATGFLVSDQETQWLDLPGGLFRNAAGADPEREQELRARGLDRPPPLQARVQCTSRTQYVGMAKYDLYLRADEPGRGEKALFAVNFFKASFGLWLRLGLVIGVAVCLSTYLSGVITMLVTLTLYLGGLSRESIRELALGQNVGGGPARAAVHLMRRELTGPPADESAAAADRLVLASDESFRVFVKIVLYVLPDVDTSDLTKYVEYGFNIPGEQMLMALLILVGYLLPWAVLAFYLMRWREVASSN